VTRTGHSTLLAVASLIVAPASLIAQMAVVPVAVTWTPDPPVQGSLFTLRVTSPVEAGVIDVSAQVGGEPLHFTVVGDGVREALAAIPIGTEGQIELPLALLRLNGRTDTMRVTIPVQAGDYRLERLTVAPRFGTPPDSATQARIRSEQQKAAAVSRQSHATPRLWDGTVVRPRETRITSRFGDGREFNGQVQSRHMGLDLAGLAGAPVKAAARGVVALVDAFFLAGNVVYIDHGQGLVSAYFHLSRQDVAAGDTVEAGQVIGQVGATGRVTGPHLHWVVRYGSITVSPLSLLALADSAQSRGR